MPPTKEEIKKAKHAFAMMPPKWRREYMRMILREQARQRRRTAKKGGSYRRKSSRKSRRRRRKSRRKSRRRRRKSRRSRTRRRRNTRRSGGFKGQIKNNRTFRRQKGFRKPKTAKKITLTKSPLKFLEKHLLGHIKFF